jgi:glycerol-3-phosphate cytidylyltransferase
MNYGKITIGYTTGVFDLFHIGHLNILRRAKERCDRLIVGVTTDELCLIHKKKIPVIPYSERAEIIRSIRYVDDVVAESTLDKVEAWKCIQFNRIFKGSDWKGTSLWNEYEHEFKKVGVEVIYFPYTEGTSSTKLLQALEKL